MGRLSSLFRDALKTRAGRLTTFETNVHPKAILSDGQPIHAKCIVNFHCLQWTGGNKAAVRQFLGDRLIESIRPDRDFGLTTINKGDTTVWVGDWMVTGLKGISVYSPEEFTANFSPIK